MKLIILTLTAALTSFAIAQSPASDWKVISETQDCPKKVQIKAKKGEKYVIAVEGKNEYKLKSVSGAAFDPDSMNAVEYASEKNENQKSTDAMEYSFIQPSYVENRPAKLQFSKNGKADRCPLIAK